MGTRDITIGVIGGSGFDDPRILEDFKEKEIDTPFGRPSSPLALGKIEGVRIVIISRHGKNHSLMPTKVPFRANIWALKDVGCTHILATTACGSLREEIRPGDFVLPDQFIDNTKHRALTFFEDKVIHTSMADPFCPKLRKALESSAAELGLRCHTSGTIITIEGPCFSTRAESMMYRAWQADIINMSTVPEVILARELGICYQAIAMSTDYDCWRKDEKPVTWEMIVDRMKKNSENIKKLLFQTIPKIDFVFCACNGHKENN